jgi:hypothetical protein
MPPLNRRSILKTGFAGAVTVIGGCLSADTTGQSGLRTIAVEESDDISGKLDATMAVEMLNQTVTGDEPATLRVTLTNNAPAQRSFQTGSWEVFAGIVSSGTGENRLILRCDCPGIDATDKTSPDCWRWNHEHVGAPGAVWIGELASGESVHEDYTVFGHPKNSGPCLPPGSYRFEDNYTIKTEETQTGYFSWGFSLLVT